MVDPSGRVFEFFKMSGAGNDFIVADNRLGTWSASELAALARGLCRRRLSVGADGLILIENSKRARLKMRIYNPDGGEAAMCGNGGRCAARFAFIKVIAGRQMTIETQAGALAAEVLQDGRVQIEMPMRISEPAPVTLDLDGRGVSGYRVDAGVPHLVVFVRDIEKTPVETLGRRLRSHPQMGPDGTNVDFVAPASKDGTVAIRTYERGVEAETLACGTGAAAVAWVLNHVGEQPTEIRLHVRSGKILEVAVRRAERSIPTILVAGEAAVIYQGRLSDEALEEVLQC
jgi:diaminopimelate epimerase